MTVESGVDDGAVPQLHSFLVALALTLTKSKPQGVSVREYLHKLKDDHARAKSRAELIASKRDPFTKQLQITIEQLQRQLRARHDDTSALKAREKSLEEELQLFSSGDIQAYIRSLVLQCSDRVSTAHLSLQAETEPLLPKGPCRAILYHTYRTDLLLQRDCPDELATLAAHLLQIPPAIFDLVCSVRRPVSRLKPDEMLLQSVLRASARTLSMLFLGWRKLAAQDINDGHCRMVESTIVDLFHRLVSQLSTKSQHSYHDPEQMHNTSRPSTRSTTRLQGEALCQKHEQQFAGMLVAILERCLQHLQADNEAERRIFQGCLSSIMIVIGRHLFKAAFGHDKCASIEEDIRAVNKPAAHSHDSGFTTPALVSLLEHALAMALRFAPSEREVLGESQTSMATKHWLQTILVRSVFGQEAGDEASNGLFSRTGPILSVPPVAPIPEGASHEEWFQQEVWRVIGWDMLAA